MRRVAVLCLLCLAAPAFAWAAARLTARETRIAAHPALVRVVVELGGGDGRPLLNGEIMLRDPAALFRDGSARVDVTRARIRSTVGPHRAKGVEVRVAERNGMISVRLDAADRRFKALEEVILHDPERLVLDLWKSAPPSGAASVRNDGCLALDTIAAAPGRVRVSGRALRRLFENSLVVQVRAPNGSVIAMRPATAARGRWQRTVTYTVGRRARGTLEAAVFSAKDGSLECLVQVPLTLMPG